MKPDRTICNSGTARIALAFAGVLALAIAFCGLGIAPASSWATETEFAATALNLQGDGQTAGDSQAGSTRPMGANVTGQANVNTLFAYGYYEGKQYKSLSKTVKKYDVTGDGHADTIKVVVSPYKNNKYASANMISKVQIYVNGKLEKTVTDVGGAGDRVLVKLYTLKNKKPFLFVDFTGIYGTGTQIMLQHDGDAFATAFSNKDAAKANTSYYQIGDVTLSGNKVAVTYCCITPVTGATQMRFTYKYKKGALVRTSDTTNKIGYSTTATNKFTKTPLTAAISFRVYKSTDLKKTAFTVKKGTEKIQPLEVCLRGSRMLFKVSVGGHVGWVRPVAIEYNKKTGVSTFFKETYDSAKVTTPSAYNGGGEAIARVALNEYQSGVDDGTGHYRGEKYWSLFSSRPIGWCSSFVGWCLVEAGYERGKTMPKTVTSSSSLYNFYQSHPELATIHPNDGSYIPQPGDLALTLYTSSGVPHSAIIVESSKNGTYYDVEGNCGNKVKKRQRSMSAGWTCFVTLKR